MIVALIYRANCDIFLLTCHLHVAMAKHNKAQVAAEKHQQEHYVKTKLAYAEYLYVFWRWGPTQSSKPLLMPLGPPALVFEI